MSSNWQLLSKNHVLARDWPSIRNVWSAASNGFNPTQITDLSEALHPIVEPGFDARDNVTVFDFPGRHVASFYDAAAALLKCAYLLRTVGNCLIAGQPTWAAVDAYHFSFVAGRALLAFMGLNFVQIKDTYCLLDVFPEGVSERDRAQFKRLNPSVTEPVRLIFRNKSTPIEQRGMWTILVRAIRVTSLSAVVEKDLKKICELGEGFGKSRNELIYRNSSWIYEEDFKHPSRDVAINDDIHSYADIVEFFVKQRDANFAFAAIFARVLSVLAMEVQERGGVDILQTSYAPCLHHFPGFNLQGLEALFATIYKKEGYSVDI